MKIAFVGCCYEKDIYSHNFALLTQIAESGGIETCVVSSNCNCFFNSRKFKLDKSEFLLKACHAVTIPYIPLKPSRKHGFVKYMVVRYLRLNIPVEISRGLAFCVRCLRSDIIHFDQVLKAFGAVSFLTLLVAAKALRKKVIVTVHEIDPIQQDHPRLNRLYNLADQIVVFSNAFLRELHCLGNRQQQGESHSLLRESSEARSGAKEVSLHLLRRPSPGSQQGHRDAAASHQDPRKGSLRRSDTYLYGCEVRRG